MSYCIVSYRIVSFSLERKNKRASVCAERTKERESNRFIGRVSGRIIKCVIARCRTVEAGAKDVNDSISVVHETRREHRSAINTKGSACACARAIGSAVISSLVVPSGFGYGCLAVCGVT